MTSMKTHNHIASNTTQLQPAAGSWIKITTLLLVALLVSGCNLHLRKLPKDVEVNTPKNWDVGVEQKQVEVAEVTEVYDGWLTNFEDKELQKYVKVALENNPDLLESASQLRSAIEQVSINGSSLWPNLSANLQSRRNDNETDGITTKIRTVSGTLDVSWEADIWGKLTQRKKSAAYSALAQNELYRAAELSLVANVCRGWYNLVSNKLQVDLARQRLDSFKNTAELIDENYKRGLRSALDVYLSRSDVQVQISSLSDRQFDYIQSLRAFKSLLGKYPDTDLEFEANLPTLSDTIPSGLPAQLLERRPDLKASQLQYKSQIASAKVAQRNRYPSISFNGSIGDSRERFNQLFESDNMIMTLISGVALPVFQAGALKAQEKQAVHQAEAAYASLLKTTLRAYEEVENGLSREALLATQHTAIKEAVNYAQGGLDLALDRYQSGIENYTTVLESQRRVFDSMRNEINLRNALLQNRIGLHLALGGDFTEIPTDSDERPLPTIQTTKK